MLNKFGYARVGCCSPKLEVANVSFNCEKILENINIAYKKGIQIIVFPELCITGYTCNDLFFQTTLQKSALQGLNYLINNTKNTDITFIVGLPLTFDNQLFNCAAVIKSGKILGIVPKTYIPNQNEFYEQRWFSSSDNITSEYITILEQTVPLGKNILFKDINSDICFSVEICDDLCSPCPPSTSHVLNGANIIFNLSASNEVVGKYNYIKELIKITSAKLSCSYVYASSGTGESTTDLVFGGKTLITENGNILSEGERYSLNDTLIYTDIDINYLMNERYKNKSLMKCFGEITNYKKVSLDISDFNGDIIKKYPQYPFVPINEHKKDEVFNEIINIQTSALCKRLMASNIKKAIIGISGGLDSTLAFLVVNKAFEKLCFDKKDIISVTMPGFGTTSNTYNNSLELIKSYETTLLEIDIKEVCTIHFKDISHNINNCDSTYENAQARERMQILMDLANKENGLVIGTSDLSELALGYTTYNGDHMSMYSINCSIPKTLIKHLIKWISEHESEFNKNLLDSILKTPISPELLPPDKDKNIKQKTEDIIGPYELHDFFLYYMIRCNMEPQKILYIATKTFDGIYKPEDVKKWLQIFIERFFVSQFKRSCIPDGPKVGSVALSPRGDWKMPSDASYKEWIKNLKN